MSKHSGAPADLNWTVSSACEGGQCIRVARNGEFVMVGNTSNPDGLTSAFTVDEWQRFLIGVKLGDFDGIA